MRIRSVLTAGLILCTSIQSGAADRGRVAIGNATVRGERATPLRFAHL